MFDCFVSLGSACPVAASMSKYGLRSFSGPFDWLITQDLGWVLHYIDTDFQDFLLPENLERYDECVRHFRDKKSDVRFLHESLDFEKEYEKLKEKYRLRIERFLAKTRSRTCYLRSIDNEEEFTYIKQNAEWIRRVIQKQNHDSEIVFLCRKQLSVSGPIFMGGGWDAAIRCPVYTAAPREERCVLISIMRMSFFRFAERIIPVSI